MADSSHTKDFEVKRNEILDVAEQLFTTQGYEVTTVNALLRAVGIAKGTFYYYFASKEEVMEAVIMRMIDEELASAQAILAQADLTAIEKLSQALLNQPQSPQKTQMLASFRQTNNALMKQRALQLTLELLCPTYAAMIEEGNEQTIFAAAQPLAASQFLVAGLQTIYDLSSLPNSKIVFNWESALEFAFHVLQIDEAKISRQQLLTLTNNGGNENE